MCLRLKGISITIQSGDYIHTSAAAAAAAQRKMNSIEGKSI